MLQAKDDASHKPPPSSINYNSGFNFDALKKFPVLIKCANIVSDSISMSRLINVIIL